MYAELHCKSNFSFLVGASHPDELIQRAAQLGYRALAITDLDSLAGIVRAHVAAREVGLKLIVGAQITLQDAPPVVLWAPDRAAYGKLCRLISLGRMRAPKGQSILSFEDLANHADGLLAGVLLHGDAAVMPPQTDAPRLHGLAHWLGRYRDLFQDRCYVLLERHLSGSDHDTVRFHRRLARWAGVPTVVANDVHYHLPYRRYVQDVLTAIRFNQSVSDARAHLLRNAERYLKPIEQIRCLWSGCEDALRRTVEIADRCSFRLDELRYEYPEELCPQGKSLGQYLRELVWAGAKERYPNGIPAKVRQQIEHELRIIHELGYEAYFLTVWDIVRFARSRNILCQGRGSAANSAVCYCLGITAVDPEKMDLLFERFVSRERNEPPDIDVDFEHQRREEVIQYLYRKYGRERAGLAAAVITYQTRSAIRDVGKALGLSQDCIDRLAKAVDAHGDLERLAERFEAAGVDPTTSTVRRLIWLVRQLVGFPRHLSQHVGGMVISRGPLCEVVPIENAAMAGRTVIQWDKDDLEELGILKVDCLALGMLTALHRAFDLVRTHYRRPLTLATVPPEDPTVYDMICRADTIGVFQIESRAQMNMLPRLRPRCFYDLVIEVAIVRPGPIQGEMVHPYLRRRQGLEPVHYPNEAIRRVLEKTLGVPLFQEQAMRLAVVAAGFTPGEADQLRRAMGAWRRPGLIEQFRQKLIQGMLRNGLTRDYAEAVFRQIRGFGEYGFPESHAASFALLVYVSAWLKRHYPAAFLAALLNSQPMGFYPPAQLVQDARRHGVTVLPVDVNASEWECLLEPYQDDFAVRLGFCLVRGLGERAAGRLVRERQRNGPFRCLAELHARAGIPRDKMLCLARADAFGSLGLSRRQAVWQALALDNAPRPLLNGLLTDQAQVSLPNAAKGREILEDYLAVGLSLRAHPLELLRPTLRRRSVCSATELRNCRSGQYVRVAGLVLVRQRPGTAKGVTFVTLEDETGMVNLMVRPDVWERYRTAAHGATLLFAEGKLDRQADVHHVLVTRMEDWSSLLGHLRTKTRDFR